MRGFLVRWGYHVTRPIKVSANDLSFIRYKQELRKARREVHRQAAEYQNAIEDQYLRRHQAQMERKHMQRQCSFRKACFLSAYKEWKQAQKRRQQNQKWQARVGQALQGEEVRRINRSRILKIMQHESTHYWFNAQNVDQRLGEETIFPEYVASTEYYYKLFAEALSYEVGDFQQLHIVTSNQEIIRQKNKRLIPIYLDLRRQISNYKKDTIAEEHQRHATNMERIKASQLTPEEKETKLTAEMERHAGTLKDEEQKVGKGISGLKSRVVAMVNILNTWKEYTNVLALTSAQILQNQFGAQEEVAISRTKIRVENELKSKQGEGFVDSIEEDTEEQQITFQEFRDRVKANRSETSLPEDESMNVGELNRLLSELKQSQSINADQKQQTILQQQQIDFSPNIAEVEAAVQTASREPIEVEVSPEFLNPRETTASVEILKETLKNDPEAMQLLDQLGEIDVRYPRLFESIWNTVHS